MIQLSRNYSLPEKKDDDPLSAPATRRAKPRGT